jgi:hypothetical protein
MVGLDTENVETGRYDMDCLFSIRIDRSEPTPCHRTRRSALSSLCLAGARQIMDMPHDFFEA